MKRVLLFVVLATMLAWAKDVSCPLHPGSVCWDTGRVAPRNPDAHLYKCTCGDTVWVAE